MFSGRSQYSSLKPSVLGQGEEAKGGRTDCAAGRRSCVRGGVGGPGSSPWLPSASALKFLHERNISHLDLKPQNILLSSLEKPHLKLAGVSLWVQGCGLGAQEGAVTRVPLRALS